MSSSSSSSSSSTFHQFIERFKKELNEVAEVSETDENKSLLIIISVLQKARLKELLDELDLLKSTADPTAESSGPAKKAPVPRGKKAASGGATASSKAAVEVDQSTSKPEKPKRVTGYNVFVAEQVKENQSSMKNAAALWKDMSAEAKGPYNERAAAQNQA